MPRLPRFLPPALGLAALLALGLAPGGAEAQAMQSYLPRRLTGSDLDILRAEAAKLGPNGPAEEGWTNPKTGHSGVVTFVKAFEHAGMACRGFKYIFHTGTPTDGLPYQLNWCKKPNGDWVMLPPKG